MNDNQHALYSRLADYYDRFYWWKDYDKEVDFLIKAFEHYNVKVRDILEVACGTGNHAVVFAKKGYKVTGVDISGDVLRIARTKLGARADFLQGDMRCLDRLVQGKTFDAVVCLFSSISYNRILSDLKKTVRGMSNSVRPGGFVAFDTHFTKQSFMDGYRGEDIFDDGKVMGARLSVSKRHKNIGEIAFSYLISDGSKTVLMRNDVHHLGLFNKADFQAAMREAGLVRLKTFTGWTFEKEAVKEQFNDTIFAGCRPST